MASQSGDDTEKTAEQQAQQNTSEPVRWFEEYEDTEYHGPFAPGLGTYNALRRAKESQGPSGRRIPSVRGPIRKVRR